MNEEQQKQYDTMLKIIDEIENDDDNLEVLKAGAEYWCSNWDLCEGYKEAMRLCLHDQYFNHASEQEPDELKVLTDILLGKIKMENNDDKTN
jgi:hypothetical protein